ncbi:MAG: site-specific DNA-methyltransferase [Dysgonamonadaceae bacterium]|nr:site-specific DNA-methyltransferase [Dysgonamonadaceae bacterium]
MEENKTTRVFKCKKRPLKDFENIMVFNEKGHYKPQGLIKGTYNNFRKSKLNKSDDVYGEEKEFGTSSYSNYPKTILEIKSETKPIFSTQKPVALLEYLIKTYTNENELILDNCIGSGTTAIAAINTNRNYIGFELDEKYYQIAQNRISDHTICSE